MREGAKVLATDVNAARLDEAFGGNPDVATVAIDVTAAEAPDAIIGGAVERFGRLDILVNAAGIFAWLPLEDADFAAWERMMDINLNAPARLCVRAIPALKASGEGRIVNIASTNALRAREGMGCYTVSKHGVAGLTLSLAVELAKYGITANHINPGTILTGITRALADDPLVRRDLNGQGLMNRMGTVDEIAQAVLYLVGPNSGFTTGLGLAVDGGFLVKYPDRPVTAG